MKYLAKFIWGIVKTIGFIALFSFLLASFSDRVSPYTCLPLQYLGLFFPLILGINVLFFIVFLIFKQWKSGLVFLVVFLLCSGSIHTYFPLHRKTEKIPDNCIKLLTYNVMRFDLLAKHEKKHPNPVVQYIIDQKADIICIQEYGALTNGNHILSEEALIKAFSATPYYYIERLRPSTPQISYGLAIFSKYPILNVKKIPYDSEYNGSIIAELNIRGKKVTLINNHLESNKLSGDERTGYYDMTKEINTEKLENFTHMMSKRLTPAYKTRALQAQLVDKIIRENKNPYIIVCGDFNDTPISYVRHKIKGDLEDAFVTSGNGMGITFNRYRFLFRIDYIFHSKNMKAYNCTVGKLRNSDHYPVSTYLEFIE
ncbi:MAG: endonuclease/exonuclease/phosphatase family protein [Dysgonamonadaceae bacterium]|jgi:endonuclease/exonuclease/phosphatase family metal-dependent hydrolase|nr:endonuclease/exonuclease/phosphatase family protein [Dysgonamonadaceae bacterium]